MHSTVTDLVICNKRNNQEFSLFLSLQAEFCTTIYIFHFLFSKISGQTTNNGSTRVSGSVFRRN